MVFISGLYEKLCYCNLYQHSAHVEGNGNQVLDMNVLGYHVLLQSH